MVSVAVAASQEATEVAEDSSVEREVAAVAAAMASSGQILKT